MVKRTVTGSALAALSAPRRTCYPLGLMAAAPDNTKWTSDPGAPVCVVGGPEALLCLHGLTSSPYEMLPLARAAQERGWAVSVPRLVGHGTSPEALAHTCWSDWLGAARRAFDALARQHERVFVAGLSMGALIAASLAHERGARVAGLVLMATPLTLDFKTQQAFHLARFFPFADMLPLIRKKGGPDVSDPGVAAAMPSYDRVPLAAAATLVEGQRAARARLPTLRVPTLVQHGRNDHVAPVENADATFDLLRMAQRRKVVYPRSWHILPLDVESHAVVEDALGFLDALAEGRDARRAHLREDLE
jgi:carboxylesterase